MTKKDLRSGMIVETRNGNKYLVIEEMKLFTRQGGYMEYETHKDNLTYCDSEFDVMKVYKGYRSSLTHMLEKPGELLWERKLYFNGKVVCVEKANSFLTKGKIYEFKNGYSVDDEGGRLPKTDPVASIEELNKRLYSDFIEVVE